MILSVVEEKLEHFANDIMADVALKRQKILDGVDKTINEKYDRKETEFYTEAYEIIQGNLKKIDKEKNEIISKATMANKILLLNKRTEIINNVFESAREKLRAFTLEKDYYDYLVNMIKNDLDAIGDGEIIIILNASDERYLKTLEKQFNHTIKLENKNIDMIGGCKLLNKTTNTFLDDSFENRLENQKESFLHRCKLEVE